MKSLNFGSSYLVDGFSEGEEIWQLDRGGLLHITTQIGELWNRGPPSGVKILKGVKNFL